MKKILFISMLVFAIFTSVFAQEKVVGDLSVKLGVISWKEMQVSSKEKPLAHTEKFHRKMAKAMSEMHDGNTKDAYHVMVMLSEKSTGKDVKHAKVVVTAVASTGPEQINHKLEQMQMDGFNGYGKFFKLKFPGQYVFKIDIKTNFRDYKTEFERTVT